MTHSFTEENYLKIIYHLSQERSGAEVTTNALAEQTQTKAASVSDMLKKLSEKKLVNYQKYQGVSLTNLGEKIALKIIRKHRLWEVFLVNKLHFTWDEVHPLAEELEHIDSEQLIDKLDEYLGYPQFDPHGDPIPNSSGQLPQQSFLPLNHLDLNTPAILMGVSEHTPAFLKYLDKIKLILGSRLQIIDRIEFDQSIQIKVDDGALQFLSLEVSKNLLVKTQNGAQ